jgi:hypothetical protein
MHLRSYFAFLTYFTCCWDGANGPFSALEISSRRAAPLLMSAHIPWSQRSSWLLSGISHTIWKVIKHDHVKPMEPHGHLGGTSVRIGLDEVYVECIIKYGQRKSIASGGRERERERECVCVCVCACVCVRCVCLHEMKCYINMPTVDWNLE